MDVPTGNCLPCTVMVTKEFRTDIDCDGIILVAESVDLITDAELAFLRTAIERQKKIDASVGKEVMLLALPDTPFQRLVFSPTGPTNRDYDDHRRFSDAAGAGLKRAKDAGMSKPLLIVIPSPDYPNATLVGALGLLQVAYVPFEIRADVPEKSSKLSQVTILATGEDTAKTAKNLQKYIEGIESGRLVARDIGGSDPERMAAPNVAKYVTGIFPAGSSVKVEVISDDSSLLEQYPLFSAVNRCAKLVDRHKGRVIKLEYVGSGEIKKTLMLVGKGVTYDTGGADVKAGGVMAGMHRDKCGAATVAGFFKTLDTIRPAGIKVVGTMAMVRNSIGVESYVADEIITSRAGVRVRVGNTDAEGRMAMGDCLCEMKEKALNEVEPQIMTIATLTGHAIRAMGQGYSIIMDNGPAKKKNNAINMQKVGDLLADPFEISNIRREDYTFHKGKSEYEDVLQSNNLPSTMTARGHQTPAAFLIMASGLDKHGQDSTQPIPYSHIDIAGSSGPFPGVPTGATIPTMTALYLMGY
ncbi:putative aminopeptidase W07G4.4 [Diadema antillarum]|uniref:putative aminopeptidase W07G4.4 n=1 Tax=Diadema antillarum TaxID=105358 RepID=UPI003A85DD15